MGKSVELSFPSVFPSATDHEWHAQQMCKSAAKATMQAGCGSLHSACNHQIRCSGNLHMWLCSTSMLQRA